MCSDFVSGSLGLFFTLAFMWVVTRIVKEIVEEKEFRIKEGMKMMGLSVIRGIKCALFISYKKQSVSSGRNYKTDRFFILHDSMYIP